MSLIWGLLLVPLKWLTNHIICPHNTLHFSFLTLHRRSPGPLQDQAQVLFILLSPGKPEVLPSSIFTTEPPGKPSISWFEIVKEMWPYYRLHFWVWKLMYQKFNPNKKPHAGSITFIWPRKECKPSDNQHMGMTCRNLSANKNVSVWKRKRLHTTR